MSRGPVPREWPCTCGTLLTTFNAHLVFSHGFCNHLLEKLAGLVLEGFLVQQFIKIVVKVGDKAHEDLVRLTGQRLEVSNGINDLALGVADDVVSHLVQRSDRRFLDFFNYL